MVPNWRPARGSCHCAWRRALHATPSPTPTSSPRQINRVCAARVRGARPRGRPLLTLAPATCICLLSLHECPTGLRAPAACLTRPSGVAAGNEIWRGRATPSPASRRPMPPPSSFLNVTRRARSCEASVRLRGGRSRLPAMGGWVCFFLSPHAWRGLGNPGDGEFTFSLSSFVC